MTDPERWLRDPHLRDDVRELLEAGETPPHMPPGADRRLSVFVTRVAAGSLLSSALLSTKVVAAVLAVSVGGTVTWATVMHGAKPAEQPVSSSASGPQHSHAKQGKKVRAQAMEAEQAVVPEAMAVPTPGASVVPNEAPLLEREPAEAHAPVVAPTPAHAAKSRPATGTRKPEDVESAAPQSVAPPAVVPPPAPEDPLAAEALLLERARSVLAYDPAAALAQADLHARLYEQGQLSAERELIAIDALSRLGRAEEAEQRAHALIERGANGMYARRARRLIGLPEQP